LSGRQVRGSRAKASRSTAALRFSSFCPARSEGVPSELIYEKNGLMFGNRLIRETGGKAGDII